MKLVYVTSQAYPSKKVDPTFWKKMAEAFTAVLSSDFLFIVRGSVPPELAHINTVSIAVPRNLKRSVAYFFYLPWLIRKQKWNLRETVFFSADAYLLSILIFWRKVLRLKYRICSDWHQMFDDWRDVYVAGNSDYLITTSRKLKELLISRCLINPEKILVAYGGVEADSFIEKRNMDRRDIRIMLGLPEHAFLVGYVGGFRSVGLEKGLDTMIKALPHLNEKVHMVFVGGSKQHIDEYQSLAHEFGVESRSIFVEKQPFERVVDYELAIDVLVIPYPDTHHFRNYGFPLKVWEYMASGRPIVYSNIEIMDEVLKGKATSFQPEDARSLADVVSSIYQDQESAERVARANPQIVRAYTWKERARNILNFIGT